MRKKIPDKVNIVLISILFIVAVVTVFILSHSKTFPQSSNTMYEDQPTLGNPEAKVTIVEFADFKCPACKLFHDSILPVLQKEFINTGKVNFQFINYPILGADSITAAIAGEIIYNEDTKLFWKYYNVLFQDQKPGYKSWLTKDYLINTVKEKLPEIDLDNFIKELESPNQYLSIVNKDLDLGKKENVNSVPTIFLNGNRVTKPFDYQNFKQLILKELKEKDGSGK